MSEEYRRKEGDDCSRSIRLSMLQDGTLLESDSNENFFFCQSPHDAVYWIDKNRKLICIDEESVP